MGMVAKPKNIDTTTKTKFKEPPEGGSLQNNYLTATPT